ncbi:uncharacterized protein LOC128993086 [Macrosteles quadrilineatus]|uniref:uncharacterized protein LOC128993086 n=1 Tax=Macrosteles quadrilineatus TaxID=74068 RepID=UPI0023E12175|nr:uncharacterized protein LOC128993086 [Macrosteles quadrilineatus]
MALNPDACGVIDPSIPQWKRELIIRRRALGRTLQVGSSSVKLTCPAVVAAVRQPESCSGSENIPSTNSPKCSPTAEDSLFSSLNQNRVDFHQGPSSPGSVSNMRLLDACSEVDNLVINNGIDVKSKQSGVVTNNSDTSVSYSLIMGEDKSLNLKKKNSPKSKHETINCVSSRQRIFIEKVQSEGTNGKSNKEEDCLSDSSEELQYGPGIVNKLKTKYLSMTLREQKKHTRPSLSNLRRATSLENMLDGDDNLNEQTKMGADVKVKTGNVNSIDKSTLMGKTVGLNSNCGLRSLGNHRIETMKRAQSMDTLLKSEIRGTIKPIVNENIIIVEKENIGINPSSDSSSRTKSNVRPNTELPPPDVVKQTLKIFETSPKKKVKPAGQGNLAKLVAGFSNPASQPVSSLGNRSIIDRRKVNQNNKPTLSPKPILSPEKLRRTKIGSPKRNQPSATGTVSSASRTPPLSTSNKPAGINNERVKLQLVQNEQSVAERTTATSPKVLSPRSKSPTVTVLTDNDHPSLASQPEKVHSQSLLSNGEKEVSSVHSDELEEIDSHSESCKPVPETALENIRRGGVSMQFSFSSENSPVPSNKSYLPRPKSPPQALNTSLLKGKLENSPPPTGFVPPRQQGSPQIKQVGIIRPLVSTKIQSNVSSTPALTEQEIEKNLINRVKSIEQPVSKVVVAIKALPDSVVLGSVSADVTNKSGCANSKVKSQGLWDEKVWHANQNTIVFNFSNRKEVPDYIENDGLILKGKRDRPRPGDGGFILLDESSDPDETCTEAEDLLTSLPPSPCDVTTCTPGDGGLILLDDSTDPDETCTEAEDLLTSLPPSPCDVTTCTPGDGGFILLDDSADPDETCTEAEVLLTSLPPSPCDVTTCTPGDGGFILLDDSAHPDETCTEAEVLLTSLPPSPCDVTTCDGGFILLDDSSDPDETFTEAEDLLTSLPPSPYNVTTCDGWFILLDDSTDPDETCTEAEDLLTSLPPSPCDVTTCDGGFILLDDSTDPDETCTEAEDLLTSLPPSHCDVTTCTPGDGGFILLDDSADPDETCTEAEPGDGGFILLDDSADPDETCTEAEDLLTSLPPSPCDVTTCTTGDGGFILLDDSTDPDETCTEADDLLTSLPPSPCDVTTCTPGDGGFILLDDSADPDETCTEAEVLLTSLPPSPCDVTTCTPGDGGFILLDDSSDPDETFTEAEDLLTSLPPSPYNVTTCTPGDGGFILLDDSTDPDETCTEAEDLLTSLPPSPCDVTTCTPGDGGFILLDDSSDPDETCTEAEDLLTSLPPSPCDVITCTPGDGGFILLDDSSDPDETCTEAEDLLTSLPPSPCDVITCTPGDGGFILLDDSTDPDETCTEAEDLLTSLPPSHCDVTTCTPGDGGFILLDDSTDPDETCTEAEDLLTSLPPSPCDVITCTPGDGGFILLDDSTDPDETCTEAEDLLTSLPPSPCDVTFVGDNVVINGKSNLKKMPKPVKLRIQFNDEATTMFEYPSEASLVEEELKASRGTDEGDAAEASSTTASTSTSTSTSGAPGLSMSLGGSLGTYTPKQVSASDWQFGVTPVAPPPPANTSANTEEDEHLKPAPPEATVAWSEDMASDLLF